MRPLCLAASLLAFASCSAPSTPPGRTNPSLAMPDVRAWLAVRAPSNAQIAKNGDLYVRDWPDGVNQVYRVNGASAERLTDFPDGASSFSISPDGKTLLVSAAVGGNEQDQVFAFDLPFVAGAAPRPLLVDPKAVFRVHAWLGDGHGFLYSSNDESANDFHVSRYDLADGKRTKLIAEAGSWSAPAVSRQADRVLVQRFVSESDRTLFEYDFASKTSKAFRVGTEATTSTSGVGYLDDDESIVCVSDADGGTSRVWVWHPRTGAASRPLNSLERYEIEGAELNRERSLLAVTTNEDGYGVLHVFRVPSFEEIALPPIEKGVVAVQQITGTTVVYSLSNATTPGITYAIDVGTRGAAPRALTSSVAASVDLATAVAPELVRYRSFDGLEVPAFLYVPRDRRDGERIPFVVNYHGGPEGQFRPGFDRTAQVLATRGIGVLQPNVRGSTGYGRAFHRLDDSAKRWDSVKDGVAAARWLVDEGYAEAGRIATYGGSYGGFMSVACLLEGKELFGAGIDVVGIVNFETFLEQTKGYRRKLREAEYGALDDRAFLRSISPIHRADEIAVPMMIAHGLNDPRVPVGEAMQLAVALQRRGLDPAQVYFPDEGHGFQKLENRIVFTERMVRFLEGTIRRRR